MLFLFGDYKLDVDRRELRQGPALISICLQVFDLLVYLVHHRERVVSKDDLFESVWSGRIVSGIHPDQPYERRAQGGRRQRRGAAADTHGCPQGLPLPSAPVSTAGGASQRQRASAGGNRPRRAGAALPLPDKPSIAVLPFINLSGDAEQEYFADGIVEDIIAALSRMRWLFVIARNSSFTYGARGGREAGGREPGCATCSKAACEGRRTAYASRAN